MTRRGQAPKTLPARSETPARAHRAVLLRPALLWFRCRRCNQLAYADYNAHECNVCISAAIDVWPWVGAITGEMSGV